MKFVNDLTQRGVTVKLYNEEDLLSTCTISVSNGIWGIAEWFTSSNHKQKGYGNQVMTEAFRLLYESYSRPSEIRYNWNVVNAYVFEWRQKHFSPTPLLPIAEQKYIQDDCWEAHMRKHAAILRPKFEKCLEVYNEEFCDNGSICAWTNPVGGYFISFFTYPYTAKEVWPMCKDAGVTLTEAGASYPYGKNRLDNHIRIAPSYPNVEDIEKAMRIFSICVKIKAINKILETINWRKL